MDGGSLQGNGTSSVQVLNGLPGNGVMNGGSPQGDGISSVSVLSNLRTVYADRHTLAQLVSIVLQDKNAAAHLTAELNDCHHPGMSDEESQIELVVRTLWNMASTPRLVDLEKSSGEIQLASPVQFRGVAGGVTSGRNNYLVVTAQTFKVRLRLVVSDGRFANVTDLRGRKVWVMGLTWSQSPLSITAASVSIEGNNSYA